MCYFHESALKPTDTFMRRVTIWCAWMLTVTVAAAQEIIPAPVQLQKGTGTFVIHSSTTIVASARPEVRKVASYLASELKPATGFDLKISEDGATGILLVLNSTPDSRLGKEGYSLTSTTDRVTIQANQAAGLFYGVQSLLQLLPAEVTSKTTRNATWAIPVVSVLDYPRFGWRGIMLDVSRHFFTKQEVKDYIDQMSRYKYNLLHWHLTDDEGWRIEIKSFPKLTEVGAWRVPRTGTFGSHTPAKPGEAATEGGFYTQDDIREVVQYAADRFVQVMPEVDVPGHSMAAVAAYPELSVTKNPNTKVNPGSNFSKWFGAGKFEMYIDNTLNPTDEKVYQFLDKVFAEIAPLFPFEYIHMGGDECYKGYWERDANVQAFMKKNSIKNGEELQAYFNKRVYKIVTDKKKKLIGWDEILEGGIAPGATVMSWRGVKGGIEASSKKHQVVMTPAPIYYLDMRQGDGLFEPPVYNEARLKNVYQFNILPDGIDSTYVLGGQGNLWTEQIATVAHLQYMTYPRAFAIAETLWTPNGRKDWDNFAGRVEKHFDRFDQAGVNYAVSMYDPIFEVKRNADKLLEVTLTSELPGLTIHYTIDNSIPNQYSPRYNQTIVFTEDVDMLRVVTYRNGKPVGRLMSIKTEDLEKKVRR